MFFPASESLAPIQDDENANLKLTSPVAVQSTDAKPEKPVRPTAKTLRQKAAGQGIF